MLVALAMAFFGRRRALGALPLSEQRDIKAFAGTYKKAREQARDLLFAAGDTTQVDAACVGSSVGALMDNGLVVLRRDVGNLDSVLRVLEGCAREIVGEVDRANVVKLHRFSGKVTYMACTRRKGEQHPRVLAGIKVDLPRLSVHSYDNRYMTDPPALPITVQQLNRRPAPVSESD
jgi:DNA phosphorothioation-associated putative methyltransferase